MRANLPLLLFAGIVAGSSLAGAHPGVRAFAFTFGS
jgi:hypothetical protein